MSEVAKRNDKSTRKLTAVDLFSGCGGLTTGLKIAGFNVLAAVEIDEKARSTYKLNHPEVLLAGSDVRMVDPFVILEAFSLKSGELDLLAGCPPCQGFSRMRKRNGARSARDERNSLIDDFVRFALVLLPKFIMLENVPGLAGYYKFGNSLRSLERAGYTIHHEVLDVADFGVPQRRKRLIVSASRIGLPVLALPNKIKKSVREAISHLPLAGISGDPLHDFPERRSERVKKLIEAIPLNGGSRADLPEELVLACHKKSDGFSDVYGRMSWDEPSPTITGGCINPSKGRFLHPECNRAITLREASLLQGFPPDYNFNLVDGKERIALMIGNALPPPFIAAHALSMAEKIKQAKDEK